MNCLPSIVCSARKTLFAMMTLESLRLLFERGASLGSASLIKNEENLKH
jgi:hypothetical protein